MRGFEVTKALEEGKKVRQVTWPEDNYWFHDKKLNRIVSVSPEKTSTPEYEVNSFFQARWEIYKEFVTFEEAMKAFKEGAPVRAWEVEDGMKVFCEINEAMSFKDMYEAYPAFGLGELSLLKWTIED